MNTITGQELYEMARGAGIVSSALERLRWDELPEEIRDDCEKIADTTVKVRAGQGATEEV